MTYPSTSKDKHGFIPVHQAKNRHL